MLAEVPNERRNIRSGEATAAGTVLCSQVTSGRRLKHPNLMVIHPFQVTTANSRPFPAGGGTANPTKVNSLNMKCRLDFRLSSDWLAIDRGRRELPMLDCLESLVR